VDLEADDARAGAGRDGGGVGRDAEEACPYSIAGGGGLRVGLKVKALQHGSHSTDLAA
jgi:hypothetical protein